MSPFELERERNNSWQTSRAALSTKVSHLPTFTMAPPTRVFPVGDLEKHIQYQTVDFKEKRRKVRNFDLETCELFELVQYSCTTTKEQADRAAAGDPNPGRMDCYPLVRLFRR